MALTLEGGYDLAAISPSAAATVIGLIGGLTGAPIGKPDLKAILGSVSSRRAPVAPADRPARRSQSRRSSAVPASAVGRRQRRLRHAPLAVEIVTFGFKYGLPQKADLVFDVRFLTNPFWVPDLQPLSGLSAPVRQFVLDQPQAGRFLDLVVQLLELTVPAYRAAGRERLVVALGCTGGYHRSIALAEELARRLGGARGRIGHRRPPGAAPMTRPRLPRWLYPGMHIKRWLGALLVGPTILALGAAILLIELYRGSSSSTRSSLPAGRDLSARSGPRS